MQAAVMVAAIYYTGRFIWLYLRKRLANGGNASR
jgi:hypothetical protein